MDYVTSMEIEAPRSARAWREYNWGLLAALLFCAGVWAGLGVVIATAF